MVEILIQMNIKRNRLSAMSFEIIKLVRRGLSVYMLVSLSVKLLLKQLNYFNSLKLMSVEAASALQYLLLMS